MIDYRGRSWCDRVERELRDRVEEGVSVIERGGSWRDRV